MYKVFFKDRIVFLGDPSESLNYQGIVYSLGPISELREIVEKFDREESCEELFICSENVEELFQAFQQCFKYIEAAGGWVWNAEGEFLAIHRLGKWDLPKGKVEKGESLTEAAIREVEEECGIHGLQLCEELESTYHTYWMKGKWVLKRTYWYEMKYDGIEPLTPQTEEDIEKVEWKSLDQLEDFKADTYASLCEVVKDIEKRKLKR